MITDIFCVFACVFDRHYIPSVHTQFVTNYCRCGQRAKPEKKKDKTFFLLIFESPPSSSFPPPTQLTLRPLYNNTHTTTYTHMPKHARNTKRGSKVIHAQQALQHSLELALAAKKANEARDLASIAREFGTSYDTLYRRWRKYLAARAAGDELGMATAAVSHRGGHNRAFTVEHEELLKTAILSATPAMGHLQIREAAATETRHLNSRAWPSTQT